MEPPQSPRKEPVLEIVTSSRTYILLGESESVTRDWAWAIEGALQYLEELRLSQGPVKVSTTLQSKTTSRKCGFLRKKGFVRTKWKERWFILDGKMLRYYKGSESRKNFLGSIALDECLGLTKAKSYDQGFVFNIHLPVRSFCHC